MAAAEAAAGGGGGGGGGVEEAAVAEVVGWTTIAKTKNFSVVDQTIIVVFVRGMPHFRITTGVTTTATSTTATSTTAATTTATKAAFVTAGRKT